MGRKHDRKKYCIFHVPNHIDENAKSGSHVRPRKMLEAFERIGYEVDAVMGYGKERKKQIENIKKKVKGGGNMSFYIRKAVQCQLF